MGGISELPEGIIHHILSYLKPNKTIQASVFCKTWYRACLASPYLCFEESPQTRNRKKERQEVLHKFLEGTLRRYRQEKIGIFRFILSFGYINDPYEVSLVNECIEIAIQNGVRILDLSFPGGRRYALPHVIFEAKTLRELVVLSDYITPLEKPIGDDVMFNHLHKLHLCGICLDDDMFHGLITSCPLIDDLRIIHIQGLVNIKITSLNNLKKLHIAHIENLSSIEIKAPNLEFLDSHYSSGSIVLHAAKKLQHLSVCFHLCSSSSILDSLEQKFPLVEYLRFSCNGLERINISSRSLKFIHLEHVSELREVNIDAPNMISLHFTLCNFSLTLDSPPNRGMLKIITAVYGNEENDEFFKLKVFLAKLIPLKIHLDLFCNTLTEFEDVSKIPVTPAIEVEELNLRFSSNPNTTTFTNLFHPLFLTCHPKSIMVKDENIKFIYKNLMERRNQDHEVKSWYQGLKEVRFQVYDWYEGKWHLSNLKNYAPETSMTNRKAIFRLEWDA